MTTLKTIRLLITAGATRESIDEVRFLGNRSSGQLGCLIALAGAIEGYQVTLIHAATSVSPQSHPRLTAVPFTSTRDLAAKLKEYWPSHDVLIMAAAVADFTPSGGQSDGKIPRGETISIQCAPTEDLVAGLAQTSRNDQQIIAFALGEPAVLETQAIEKLTRKKVDAIIANPLETMESNEITATIYYKDGRSVSPPNKMSKPEFAKWLVTHLEGA